jgi:hypothetical protein
MSGKVESSSNEDEELRHPPHIDIQISKCSFVPVAPLESFELGRKEHSERRGL